MIRWAAAILVTLGVGHLTILSVVFSDKLANWVDQGLWAAVPLMGGDGEPTVASLQNSVTFWGGPGSFAVPLILLGCLLWILAGRGVAIPAAIGWALAAWCVVGGVLLVPSPFFGGVISGLLIVMAARKPALSAHGSEGNSGG